MPHRFCAICGKDLNNSAPHMSMCLNCYLKEHPLFELPDYFSLKICLDCYKYSIKEAWIEPADKEILSIIKEALSSALLKPIVKSQKVNFLLSFEEQSFRYSSRDLLKSFILNVQGTIADNPSIMHQQAIKGNIEYNLCKNCSNIRSGTYFLSILQLRVKDENYFDQINKVLEDIQTFVESMFEKDSRQYITKMEDEKNGVDLYLSTNELMNHIIKHLRMMYPFILKRSKKLVGRDSQKGKNLYRLKSLIKILPINKYDDIILEEKMFKVESITKDKIILRDDKGTKLLKEYNFFFSDKVKIKRN